MIKRIFTAYKINVTVLKDYFKPTLFYVYLIIRRVIVETFFFMDNIFYPTKPKRINKIIVIAGNPRSGTTFLHRTLNNLGVGCGTEVKNFLFPPIIIQKVLNVFAPLIKRAPLLNNFSNAAHETGPDEVDCDDAAIFAHFFDGFFVGPILNGWSKEKVTQIFYPDAREKSNRDFNYLEKIWTRNLFMQKKEVVLAKFFSIGLRLQEFVKRFPECKIIYLVRNPEEAIPSGISLMTLVMEKSFNFGSLSETEKQKFYKKAFVSYVELYKVFISNFDIVSEKNIVAINYHELVSNPEKTLLKLFTFLNINPTPNQLLQLATLNEQQKNFKSRHEYSGQKFGISEEMIRNECAFVYEFIDRKKL